MKERLKKWEFPSTAALLLVVAALMAVLTYIIPAGEYERVEDPVTGRTVVVADSFTYLGEQTPVSLPKLLEAPYWGVLEAAEIIAIVFIIGGAMGIVIDSGALHAGIGSLTRLLGTSKDLILVVLMLAFGAASSLLGMAEEFIVFVPLLVTVAASLGYDKITAVGVLLFGLYSAGGFSLIGPFNLMIAQNIAELPLLSGMGLRAIGAVGAVALSIHHVFSYARKTKKDPTKSLVYDKASGSMILDSSSAQATDINLDEYEFTISRKIILLVLVGGIALMAIGVNVWGWWFEQMCAVFMAVGVVSGLIYFKGGFNKTINCFIKYASDMAAAGLLLAFSRSIIVVLTQGNIIDTIIHALSIPLSHLSGILAAWGIYVSQLIVNFFIPSSSGQAVVMMPILTPLADIIGLNRQVAVHAFMTADFFGNMVIPTHPTTLACLGIAGISYNKWFRYAWPMVLKWSLWTLLILAIGVLTNWAF